VLHSPPTAPTIRLTEETPTKWVLDPAISAVNSDTVSAFKVILDPGEKFTTVRLALNRVRDRSSAERMTRKRRSMLSLATRHLQARCYATSSPRAPCGTIIASAGHSRRGGPDASSATPIQ
jgi:hypothetical protein